MVLDFFIYSVILLASVFNFSRVEMTDSLSRIDPWTLLRASRRESYNSRNFTIYSPWIFMRLILFSYTSGLSFLRKILRHWSSKEEDVIVKLTKVTLEQRSGVNLALLLRVIMNIVKLGLKSISWSPTLINTIPPVLYTSLFSTEFKIGSIFSTSCTSKGLPNLRDFSKFLRKASSANEERMKLLSASSESRYSMAWPAGSMIRGYLWYLFMMMAFSVQRSSEGNLCDLQTNLSLGFDRNSISDSSSLYFTRLLVRLLRHTLLNSLR